MVQRGGAMIHKDAYMDSLLNKIIGETLKKYREKNKISLEELSKRINNKVYRHTLSNYELGRSKIKISMFVDICNALGVSPNDLVEEISMKYFKNAKM